jgi:rhodanese-related sulfurtransferase
VRSGVVGIAVSCLLALSLVVTAQPGDLIPNLSAQQVSVGEGVVLAGVLNMDVVLAQPSATTVVVDLRTAAEGISREAEILRERAYEYHHLPVSGATIDADQVAALSNIAADSAGKTLIVHCRSANRAAMLWGAHLLNHGQTLEQTLSAVGPVLTGRANKKALRAFSTHAVDVTRTAEPK